ncbi:hypothetical protein [Nannocystis pusilla]|uniref:hypothetical protein n=1 Tax=Nannocystis pusilla TaxID=889268 RepID=UPI003B7C5D16
MALVERVAGVVGARQVLGEGGGLAEQGVVEVGDLERADQQVERDERQREGDDGDACDHTDQAVAELHASFCQR